MRGSAVIMRDRAQEIIRHLPEEDQEVLQAHISDMYAEALKQRPPSSAFAKALGISVGISLPILFGMWFLDIDIVMPAPAPEPECEECEVCEVCPEPLHWISEIQGASKASTNTMRCYWPEGSDSFMCTMRGPNPGEEGLIPSTPHIESPK